MTASTLTRSTTSASWRTITTVDARGFHLDTTSPAWKQACELLPCWAALRWPGYQSAVVERRIAGEDVVVQLWKGRCQRFFGLDDFPGGIGAEVGIYRRETRALPTALPFLDGPLEDLVLAELRMFAGHDLWWAATDLQTTVAFDLVNPITGEVIIAAGTEQTYWLNRWLYPEDYGRYGQSQGPSRMPQSASHCLLRYSIDGEPMQYWPGESAVAAYDPTPVERNGSTRSLLAA